MSVCVVVEKSCRILVCFWETCGSGCQPARFAGRRSSRNRSPRELEGFILNEKGSPLVNPSASTDLL